MPKEKETYRYLLSLYGRIDEYLSNDNPDIENLSEIIVSFCIVVERILKIKLYRKNRVLVFDYSKLKEDGALTAVILGKDDISETIRITQAVDRVRLVFKRAFTEDEIQALLDIYKIRNSFIHGHKADSTIITDFEGTINKLGTVWVKVIPLATAIFGKNAIKQTKPKRKYTEEELEAVLIDEVKEKIKVQGFYGGWLQGSSAYEPMVINSMWSGELCPRCGAYGFSFERSKSDPYSVMYESVLDRYQLGLMDNYSGLYKCEKCHLELTRKEYEITKELKPTI